MSLTPHEKVARSFARKSDAWLSVALLVVAGVLIVLALQPDHTLLKAGALAWVALP